MRKRNAQVIETNKDNDEELLNLVTDRMKKFDKSKCIDADTVYASLNIKKSDMEKHIDVEIE